jgi:hypothetical protein
MSATIYKGAYLPQVAGDSGTWGGLQNTLTYVVFDNAIGGYAAQSLSNVNVTLSATQDSMAILRLTGTLTGNVVITSACQGSKYVENLTTGAFTVTIGTGVGTSVVLPQGYASAVIFDATNGTRLGASQPLPANGVFSGTLSVGGATTLGGTLNVAGLPTFQIGTLLTEIETPAAPAAGSLLVYSKPGDVLVTQNSAGVEKILGTPVAAPSAQFLTITNNAAVPNSKADITISGQIICTNSSNLGIASNNPGNITCDLTASGVNGMDTGAMPSYGPVYFYGINNGTTFATLASIQYPGSGILPTWPAGYTYSCYLGAMITDGAGALFRTLQTGRDAAYVIVAGTNTAAFPANNPALGASSWILKGTLVPATANYASIFAQTTGGKYLYCGANAAEAALSVRTLVSYSASNVSAVTGFHHIAFQDTKIYFQAPATGPIVYLLGWQDRVNAT